MKKVITLFLILFITNIVFSQNKNEYHPVTMKFILKYLPCVKTKKSKTLHVELDGRLPNIAIVAQYGGAIRPIIDIDLKNFYKTYGNMNRGLHYFKGIQYEFSITYKNKNYWILIPRNINIQNIRNLKKNVNYSFNVTYAGNFHKVKSRRLFLLKSINNRIPEIKKQIPFTKSLADIALNNSFRKQVLNLRSKYGDPARFDQNKYKQLFAMFEIEKKTRTYIYVFNGGPHFKDTVHSIQLTTYNSGTMKFYKNLSLGSSYKDILKYFNKNDLNIRRRNNITSVILKNNQCSFELKNGKIFSVNIAVDPNY